MLVVLKVQPRFGWLLFKAEATIEASTGLVYDARCMRGLEFDIRLDGELVIVGKKRGGRRPSRRDIVLSTDSAEIGVIRRRCFTPLGDRLMLPNSSHRLPNVCRPRIVELGLEFSRLSLLGLGAPAVRVTKAESLNAALALLAYLYGVTVFRANG